MSATSSPQHFPGVVVTELEGTYLVWCDFRCFGMSDADMKVFLTDECMLYLDNGTDFGAAGSGYQRINVACPRKTLATLWTASIRPPRSAAWPGNFPGNTTRMD